MAETKLRKREEIPKEYQWDLTALYATDEDWEKECELLTKLSEEIAALSGTLAQSADNLLSFFTKQDEIEYYAARIAVYANEKSHQDMKVAKYQGYVAKAERVTTIAAGALAFANPEILAMEPAKLEEMIASKEEFGKYRRAIDEICRFKEHTLSKEEEELLARMSEVAGTPSSVYAMLCNADMKFPSIRDVEGNRIQVTTGNFVPLLMHPDRSLRKQVYEGVYHTYETWGTTISTLYASQLKTNQFFAESSKYKSARAMALDAGNIPESVYDNLLDAVHKHLPAMHRYVSLRKKCMELERLHFYDMYIPMVEDFDRKYTYEEACELVLKALAPMGEEYVSIIKQGFEGGWVDVYENENKRSGAYSWGAYGTHPYVLLNFQGNLESVFILAHEMGHALHTYYSNGNQPVTYAGYSIFVAEVASTCNEALLIHYLLENSKDPKEKLYLINRYLESFRSTLFRQAMFAEFEYIAHTKQEAGEPVTKESLNEIYKDLLAKYHGADLVVDEEITHEWMRIPHFYTSFYVYQYATGYSAATAFAKKILTEGPEAVTRYVNCFLKGGSSKDPIDLLAAAGVDMSTIEPVEAALNVFEEYLDLLEKQINA